MLSSFSTPSPARKATRAVRGVLGIVLAFTVAFPASVAAADPVAQLELRPHCTSTATGQPFGGPLPEIDGTTRLLEEGGCLSFPAADPQNRETPTLAVGDTLDLDLIVRNPQSAPLRRVRGWIAYDPTILRGEDVSLSADFPIPSPGEIDFATTDGYVRITGNAIQEKTESVLVVARIRMTVIATPSASTVLSFASDDRAAVIAREAGVDTDILAPQQASLIVRLDAQHSSSDASVPTEPTEDPTSLPPIVPGEGESSSAQSTTSSSHAAAPETDGIFKLLQPQNLRVTSQGTTLYAAWDPLGSTELEGYHLYYGTVSGQYIQRRAVPGKDASVTIRALPQGVRYYIAVRGVNARGEETEFSREVAVTIGNANSATALLTSSTIAPGTPATGGTVSGATGLPEGIVLFVLTSALVGTIIAFRRQLFARSS